MKPRPSALLLCIAALLPGSAAAADAGREPEPRPALGPEARIIDKWRGTWQVKALRRAPPPSAEISYVETFEWVLDGRVLRSETSPKSDGGKSMSMFWFDVFTKTYRYMIFDAAGYAVELPPPSWNESTQTMEWKSGSLSPTSYSAHATFADRDTIRWKSSWKDWKGKPILELEGVSIRRQ